MSAPDTTLAPLPFLTGLVVCQDSGATLARCLESLSFCDERIVVDGGSRDNTPDIISNFADMSAVRPYIGANDQKEYARSLARGEWVLNVDSDEWISPALAEEILYAIRQETPDGYRIPVRSWLNGRWLRRGGWYPNCQKRLFRRERGYWDTRHEPHDRVVLAGNWGRLTCPIEHEPADSIVTLERKARRYGQQAAHTLKAAGYHTDPLSARLRPWWRYVRSYVLKGGFLDRHTGHDLARIAYLEGVEKYRFWR